MYKCLMKLIERDIVQSNVDIDPLHCLFFYWFDVFTQSFVHPLTDSETKIVQRHCQIDKESD